MRIVMSLVVAVFLMGGQAVAKTPDGETPAEEDICADEVDGVAYGLCNAYCEAMDCDSETFKASDKACIKIYDKFVEYTDRVPPCETETIKPPPGSEVCPCFSERQVQRMIKNAESYMCETEQYSKKDKNLTVLEVYPPDNTPFWYVITQNNPAPGDYNTCMWQYHEEDQDPVIYYLADLTYAEAEACHETIRESFDDFKCDGEWHFFK